jgi:hypothetical protein
VTHGHRGGTIGVFALVAAIAFAFGVRTARVIVGSVLLAGAVFFGYVMFRVVMGTL